MRRNSLFLIYLILAMMTIVMLSGCNSRDDIYTEYVDDMAEMEEQISIAELDIEVLNCSFDNAVTALDEEFMGSIYSAVDGDVYVDLVLKITNNSNKTLTKGCFSGSFTYKNIKHELRYAIDSSNSTSLGENGISANSVGIVHLYDRVEKEASEQLLYVNYSICGKEFEKKVYPHDARNPLEKKTKLEIGDRVDANGLYEIEVISCSETPSISATSYEGTDQYMAAEGEKFIELLLKVKNNTQNDLRELRGYVIVSGNIIKANDRIEINENTDIQYLSSIPLKFSQEEYIHIFAPIPEGKSIGASAIRFNLGGNCYYCKLVDRAD